MRGDLRPSPDRLVAALRPDSIGAPLALDVDDLVRAGRTRA
ncbi:hypothetical protein [Streptomyces sp. NPDC047985]